MRTQNNKIEHALDQQLIRARKEQIKRLSEIEHRLEYVDTFEGVEYVNDAKSSDINSTWYSIDCMEKPVIWIVSSCKYEDDYALFQEIDTDNIKAMVVLGERQQTMESLFRGRVKTIARAEHMDHALKLAHSFAQAGDVVLYSPAFSDFDQYAHYKERGQHFRKAVREMQLK
jgi:UDP-N-acetylmuramoylalanine--D-glutamate ligase